MNCFNFFANNVNFLKNRIITLEFNEKIVYSFTICKPIYNIEVFLGWYMPTLKGVVCNSRM